MAVNDLGCGEYQTFIVARGGTALSPLAVLDHDTVQWSRLLDDTSEATVHVPYAVGCAPAALQAVRPWEHELQIVRNGDAVWAGPVMLPQFEAEGATIQARDLSAWWDKRRIHSDHDYSAAPADLATVFSDLVVDAMGVDNSPNISISTSPTGVTGNQKYLGLQHLTAGPTLRSVGSAGLDWTFVYRSLLAGGVVVPSVPVGTLTDEHFVNPPRVSYDGTAQTNDVLTRGAGGGDAGDTVYGEANDTGAGTRDGILETVEMNSDLADNTACQKAAASSLALGTTALLVSSAVVAWTAPVTIDQLVPGSLCGLDLVQTGTPVSGLFRLARIDVGMGSDGNEVVTLGFQPQGTVP